MQYVPRSSLHREDKSHSMLLFFDRGVVAQWLASCALDIGIMGSNSDILPISVVAHGLGM